MGSLTLTFHNQEYGLSGTNYNLLCVKLHSQVGDAYTQGKFSITLDTVK